MTKDDLKERLAAIYPVERLLTNPAQLAPYESDALTSYRERPAVVVLAETQADVIETVRVCHDLGVPFVARGSGTSLSGGSLPVPGGVVIALNRLNRIINIDPEERTAIVETGVINLDVSKAAAPYGLQYAPDPSSQPICTIGGNLAFNSGGAHCLKYGLTSNHILGLRIVLPDGVVEDLGDESVESNGPDLVGMYIGSEGLFGIALQATLRLLPKAEAFQTVLAAYHSLAAAGEVVSKIVASGLIPAALEIMDNLAIQAAEAAVQAGYPQDCEGLLIVELDGEEANVAQDFEALMRIIHASKAYQVVIAQDAAERLQIWKGRKSAFSAVGRLSPDYIVQDGVVPRSKLAEALLKIQQLGGKYELQVANVFHAGDGNLHPLILFDGCTPGALDKAEQLAADILQLCVDYGGSITGEHGIGMEKRAYMPVMFSEADMDMFHTIHRSVDPQGLSNQGKMFPA